MLKDVMELDVSYDALLRQAQDHMDRQVLLSGLPPAPWRELFEIDSGPHVYDAFESGIYTGRHGLNLLNGERRMILGCYSVDVFLEYFTTALLYAPRLGESPSLPHWGWVLRPGFDQWLPCGHCLFTRVGRAGVLDISRAGLVGFALNLDNIVLKRVR